MELLTGIEDRHKRFLRYLHRTDTLHSFFTLFLFLQQFHLSRYIPAVELLGYIFAESFDSFSCDNFSTFHFLPKVRGQDRLISDSTRLPG